MMPLLGEIKRRKVFQVAVVYAVVAWLIIQIIGEVNEPLNLPGWLDTVVIVLLAVGFPIAVVLAWAFQITPGGVIRTQAGLDKSLHDRAPPDEEDTSSPSAASLPGMSKTSQRKSIVVLPFDNLSPDPGDAYLADGFGEEIMVDLSSLRSLRVISRTSAQHYRGTEKDVRSISRELSVRFVLEGSVKKAGEELRITCQLIDAFSDSHLWAKKYTGRMADIFDLQEQVARSILDTLAIQLDAEDDRSLAERSIADVRAYELYLRARQGIYTFSKEGLESAQRHLQRALEIAGENAVLFFQLAHVHYQIWNAGVRLDEEDLRLAQEYADRALVLDPHSPDHLCIRGLLEVTGGNAARGLAYFEAALERDPAHADALAWYPGIAGFMGLEVETNAKLEQLRRIDPLNPFALAIRIFLEINVGRFASALELALRTRKARPAEPFVEGGYAYALALNGRPREAVVVIRDYFGSKQDMLARIFSALGCAFEHDRDGVLRLLDRDFKRWAEKDFQYSEWAAQALAQVDECEQAFEWLENSVEHGNINYPYLSEYDPFLAKLRGQPQWEVLMKRVKHEWERFKSGERQTLPSSNV